MTLKEELFMKHKIRKITTTMLATICAFSSVAAISASAASSTRYAEMRQYDIFG